MARERVYRNNAAKQAAYRERHADRKPTPPALLASIGEELHGRLRQAIEAGTNRVPAAVLGKRAEDTLINLMAYVTRGVLLNTPKERGPEGTRRGVGAAGAPPPEPLPAPAAERGEEG